MQTRTEYIMALLVVLIELSVVMSGVFCVAAKQADERMQMCFPLETNEKGRA